MSSALQIKRLAKSLLQRHKNLIMATGNVVTYLPVTHWSRYIRIQNRPKRGYFTVEWWIDTRFEPGHYAFINLSGAFALLGRSPRYRPEGQNGLFEWDDPTMPGGFHRSSRSRDPARVLLPPQFGEDDRPSPFTPA
jgi:hypothetical protein